MIPPVVTRGEIPVNDAGDGKRLQGESGTG
jgi:hypothetical protein